MFHVAFLVSPICVICPTQIVRLDMIILVSICREVDAMVLCMRSLYPPDTAASAGQYPRSLLLLWCGRPGFTKLFNKPVECAEVYDTSLILKFKTGFWDYSATFSEGPW